MSLFSTTTDLAHSLSQTSDKTTPLDTSDQADRDPNSFATASKFLDDLKHLSDRINLRLKPDGSQMYPARSCRDIADYYPTKPNGSMKFFVFFHIWIFRRLGHYFIDPNDGPKSDALLVYCQLTDRLTCVNASHALIHSNIFLNKPIPSNQQHIRLMGDLLQPSEVMNKREGDKENRINELF